MFISISSQMQERMAVDYETPAHIYQIAYSRAEPNIITFMQYLQLHIKAKLYKRLFAIQDPYREEPVIKIRYRLDTPYAGHEYKKKSLGEFEVPDELDDEPVDNDLIDKVKQQNLGVLPKVKETKMNIEEVQEVEYRLFTDSQEIIDSLHIFKKAKEYVFGIEDKQFYKDTLIPLYFVMKWVDFGNIDQQGFNIFYPTFAEFEQKKETLYSELVSQEEKKEEKHNEYRDLRRRSSRLFRRYVQKRRLGKSFERFSSNGNEKRERSNSSTSNDSKPDGYSVHAKSAMGTTENGQEDNGSKR